MMMRFKKLFCALLAFVLTNTVLHLNAAEIYVAKNGKDTNDGSKEKPFATVASAVRKARELRRLNDPSINGGIFIYIDGGNYQLQEPIVIRPEDSGTPSSPTYISAAPKANVVLSGGVRISNWKKVTAETKGLPKVAVGKVWVADLPNVNHQALIFRQLWVNQKKAVRARDRNEESMNRILAWNFAQQTCRIPLDKKIKLSAIKDFEMVIHQWWAIANLRVQQAKVIDNSIELSFYQPESRIQSEHPWPAPWISKETGNSAFYLTNAIQFLDQPGEWFEDLVNHKLYYWPRPGEQMLTAEVVAPAHESLLKIAGTVDHPVTNVVVKGISFQHSTWLRPSKKGHVPLQTGMYLLDAYKLAVPGTPDKGGLENQAWVGRPPAAVEVSYATSTVFESCKFEHLASTGLDYLKGTKDSQIKGNLFKDIGGSAILIGTFSDEPTEAHLPYLPSDLREVSTNDRIENNLITDATNEDWGTVGIGAGYVSGIQLLHNEINEVAYSAISLGWGWTSTLNVMKNNFVVGNKISRYGKQMYDVAGIYTLSNQPGSVISENYIDSIYKAPYAHLPDHWFYIYTDEGSANFSIHNNWTPSVKYLQNANGPGNVWQDNGPQVANSVKQNAGLQKDFQHLLRYNTEPSPRAQINKAIAQQVVFELVFAADSVPDAKVLETFAKENNLLLADFYQWDKRLLIYTTSLKVESLKQTLKKFKAKELKLYDGLVYNFNRQLNCGLTPAKEWDHVILSANLVADEKLQHEYLEHHRTQFEKWPELSKGFCNADFQQLVIFKKDRQLILIISIPKGANLDELNPKTTANNPRVDDWNALMKKYQEGIEGTKPGEVWAFFKKIN